MSKPSPRECGILVRGAFKQAYDAMRVLRENVLLQPFLAVLYSTMDAAAWLSADHLGDVSRKDFEAWVNRFVLSGSGLKCTAADLYGARCGILHSFSAYSALQRSGKARLVSYAWGSADSQDLEQLLGRLEVEGIVVVQLDELTNAFFKGLESSIADLESRPDADERLTARAGDLFFALDRDAMQEALKRTRAQ